MNDNFRLSTIFIHFSRFSKSFAMIVPGYTHWMVQKELGSNHCYYSLISLVFPRRLLKKSNLKAACLFP